MASARPFAAAIRCDAAMVQVLFCRNITAVTGELKVRFMMRIPFNSDLTLRAWLVDEKCLWSRDSGHH